MNFTSLKYYLAVVQEKNITKAAQRLYITPQALSEHISKLESEYQIKLFTRTPRLQITYAGQRMAEFAEQILGLQRQIVAEFHDISAQYSGEIMVGIIPTYSHVLIPMILPLFHQKYPFIRIAVTAAESNAISKMLIDDALDIGIFSSRYAINSSFISDSLFVNRYCFVIPENLLIKYCSITPDEFNSGKMPDYSRLSEIPLMLTKKDGFDRITSDQWLYRNNVSHPYILSEGNTKEINMHLCATGIGATILPEFFARTFISRYRSDYPLYCIPISTPLIHSQQMIAYNQNRYLSNPARDFIAIAKQVTSSYSEIYKSDLVDRNIFELSEKANSCYEH